MIDTVPAPLIASAQACATPAMPATPDYVAIKTARPDARTQRALDTLANVLRDMRAATHAYWASWRGGWDDYGALQRHDLPPAEFAAEMKRAIAQSKAEGELGARALERDVRDKAGREYRETRWNDAKTGRLKAILFERKDGSPSGTTPIVPDAARTTNAAVWFADRQVVPWDLAARAMRDIAGGMTRLRV